VYGKLSFSLKYRPLTCESNEWSVIAFSVNLVILNIQCADVWSQDHMTSCRLLLIVFLEEPHNSTTKLVRVYAKIDMDMLLEPASVKINASCQDFVD
jgi:hypothetical protein